MYFSVRSLEIKPGVLVFFSFSTAFLSALLGPSSPAAALTGGGAALLIGCELLILRYLQPPAVKLT
jgi:hypothetical protein